jgi:hypothetical protein
MPELKHVLAVAKPPKAILQAMRRTAYDYTLFLDADTYVCAHSLQVNIYIYIYKTAYDDTLLLDADTTYSPAACR